MPSRADPQWWGCRWVGSLWLVLSVSYTHLDVYKRQFKVTIELNLFVNRVLVFSDVLVHVRPRCQMLARPWPLA